MTLLGPSFHSINVSQWSTEHITSNCSLDTYKMRSLVKLTTSITLTIFTVSSENLKKKKYIVIDYSRKDEQIYIFSLSEL